MKLKLYLIFLGFLFNVRQMCFIWSHMRKMELVVLKLANICCCNKKNNFNTERQLNSLNAVTICQNIIFHCRKRFA